MQSWFALVFAGAAFTNGAATWVCQTVWPSEFSAPSPRVEKVGKDGKQSGVYSPTQTSAVAIATTANAFADLKFRRWKGYQFFWRDVVVVAEPITNRVLISAPVKSFGEVMTAIAGLDKGPNEPIKELLNDSFDSGLIEYEWDGFWFADYPSHLTLERVDGAIQ